MAFAADVKATVGNRSGGADHFAQLIACQESKRRDGSKHVNVARDTRRIDLAIDHQRRGVEARVSQSLEPHTLAGASVVAAGETRIVDEVDVIAASHGAGNVRKVWFFSKLSG